MKEYSNPKFWKEEYTCLHCNVLAKQQIINGYIAELESEFEADIVDPNFNINKDKYIIKSTVNFMGHEICEYDLTINIYIYVKQCQNCKQLTVWKIFKDNRTKGEIITTEGEILFPKRTYHIEPNPDMPDELKKIFNEAAIIFYDSPKAAGALLRSVLEALVKREFPQYKEEALGKIFKKDDVKIKIPEGLLDLLTQLKNIGNDAAHPSLLIYENEEIKNVECLFEAINIFVNIFDSTTKHLDILKEKIQNNKNSKNNKNSNENK